MLQAVACPMVEHREHQLNNMLLSSTTLLSSMLRSSTTLRSSTILPSQRDLQEDLDLEALDLEALQCQPSKLHLVVYMVDLTACKSYQYL